MKLYGICGRAGSGKDSVADFLVSQYGYEKVSFAAILKKMLAAAGMQEPADRDLKEANVGGFDFSWRHAAQTLGTEWGRQCLDPDIWVKLTMKSLREGGKYVVSDVRYPNEVAAIKQAGGTMIHLYGRGVNLGVLASHSSEQTLEPTSDDYTIWNTGSLDYLYDKILVIIDGN